MATTKSTGGTGRVEGGAGAERPGQTAETPEKVAAGFETTGGETEIKFFDGTVTKIDKNGNEVMSDHLAPGETLRRKTKAGERYEYTTMGRSDEDKDAKDDKRQAKDDDAK